MFKGYVLTKKSYLISIRPLKWYKHLLTEFLTDR